MYNQALILIEDKVMTMVGKSLQQLQLGMPVPVRIGGNRLNREMIRETSYDTIQLAAHVAATEPTLSPDQALAFTKVVDLVRREVGGMIFLDAPGGTGKTFLLNLLLAKVRPQKLMLLLE